MPQATSATLDQLNDVLVLLFALECALKLIAFGPIRFVSDNFNIFDTVVVLAGLPSMVCASPAAPRRHPNLAFTLQ